MSHLLEVNGLTYYYPSSSSACLKEINIIVEKGDFLGNFRIKRMW